MDQRVYLTLDLGTSGCRAAAFTGDGRRLAHRRALYPTETPRPGWVEQDPKEWEKAALEALGQVMGDLLAAGISGGDVASLAVTGQMAGLVLVDGEGGHPYPALPWSDRRAEPVVTRLQAEMGPRYYETTGCHASSVYPAVKLMWIAAGGGGEELRRAVAAARWVLSPKDELLRRLTGSPGTDRSCAVATGLWNLQSDGWDEALCRMAGVRAEQLPPVLPMTAKGGGMRKELARRLGLPAGLPVLMGAGDGVCQNLGVNVMEPGDIALSLGSSGVVRGVTSEPLIDRRPGGPPRVTAYPFVGGAWVTNGATANAAGVFDWLARILAGGSGLPLEGIDALAPGSENVLFLPYLAGERSPLWEPSARGVFFGLTGSTRRVHLVRAAVEGVAMAMRRLLDAFREHQPPPRQAALAGGAGTDARIAQILADVLKLPLLRFPEPGLEALRGAAILGAAAGDGAGDALADAVRRAATQINPPVPERFEPRRPGAYDEVYARFVELTDALMPLFRRWA
ncbi:xylulokinase [Limnochorda pilosa]|uniref:Gluconokinase n=1 Tax=Limnochorda pilosa TaxID=1555112 RepID=A0A0K2SM20_LIMPI|nr:FGGY family carbohydrate kinase [Limnochorda pilosa]BAS28067.1 gluconokinase [Limnochorda pilosa]